MNGGNGQGALDVQLHDGDAPPAVLYFPDGRPTDEREAKHQIHVRKDQSVEVVREEPANRVTYVGTELLDVKRPCRYALGVFHRKSRRLELLPVLGEGVLRMEPRVEGLQYVPSNSTTVSAKGTEKERWLEGTRAALTTFGGSVSKKRIRESAFKLPTEQSVEAGDAIESIMKSITSKSKADGLTKKQVFEKTSDSRNLPPYHEDGCTVEEAFVFDELCPPFHQERLRTAAFLEASSAEHKRLDMVMKGESGFVMTQIEKLGSLNETEQQHTAIRRTTKKQLDHFARAHDMDLQLLEHLLSIFFEERHQRQTVKYQMPESKSKLLLCYVLIVALMITDSELDHGMVDMLRTELKTTSKSMMRLFQSFGARVIKTGQHSGFAVRCLKDGKTLKVTLPKITESQLPRRFRP